MIKFAAAYVIIIFVIGFFGSSQSFVAQPQSDFSSQQSYQDSHPSQVESKDSDYYYYKGAYSIGLEVDRDVSNEAVELIVRNSLSGNEFYHFRAAVDGMEDGVARRQMRRSYP